MRAELRRRVGIGVLLGAGALLLTTGPLWGAYLGRQIPWLEVERVEVSGTRLVAPHEVLAASGIREGQHLLDEREVWEEAIRRHPVIADVRIERKAPGTLRIRVIEKRAVALVADGALQPATGAGEILPVDPAVVPLDLPIVHGSAADSAGAADLTRLLAEVERLTAVDPELAGAISEIRTSADDPEVMVLSHAVGEILLPFGATATRTAELRAVLADVRRRADPTARPRLDLRFADQVVVRHSSARELS